MMILCNKSLKSPVPIDCNCIEKSYQYILQNVFLLCSTEDSHGSELHEGEYLKTDCNL